MNFQRVHKYYQTSTAQKPTCIDIESYQKIINLAYCKYDAKNKSRFITAERNLENH